MEINNLFNIKPTLGNDLINELENYLKKVNALFPTINPNYDKNAKINLKIKNRRNKINKGFILEN